MRLRIIFISLFLSAANLIFAQTIERAEPPCWWIGMKTDLQLMFYGKNIAAAQIKIVDGNSDVRIAKIHKADNPNYVFVDVEIAENATAGDYIFEFSHGKTKTKYNYKIYERRENSAQRKSFTSADLVYLIMSDRFANGDTTNDSTDDTSEKANRNDHFGRHGGDIQGIINHLDYIADLGVTAIWCTPLLLDDEPKSSYHGYACADYYKIDPRYGSNELFKTYVEKSHDRGLKIIMDVVTNHCGMEHWWMRDLPFADWVHQYPEFTRSNYALPSNSDPNASEYDKKSCLTGWFDTMMPDINLANPFVLQYFKQWAVWWIEWANLDGLRTDTHPYNDKNAMVEWCKTVRQEYPNINIVGECWISSPALTAYWEAKKPNRDGFCSNLPSVMDFPLQENICMALADYDTANAWSAGMVKVYNVLTEDFLYDDVSSLLIFVDNHDITRFADVVKNNPNKVKIAITLLATLRGTPQIFYGTELMLTSADLNEGHGGLRVDFPGGWADDKINLFDSSQRSSTQKDVFDFTKKIFNWRKTATVIHNGKTKHFVARDNTYSYFRYNDNEAIFVYINASEGSRDIDWSKYVELTKNYSSEGVDIITGEKINSVSDLRIAGESVLIVRFGR